MTLPTTKDTAAGPASAQFEPSRGGHVQLSETVATYLREQIVSGKLKKGQFLRIDAISKALGVSMTPVREGLLLLQSEAFVRLIPRRGFIVNSFSREDLLDLFWAQAVIGAELAARAATRMPVEEIDRLQNLETAYEAAVTAGEPIRDRLGHQFHRAINLAAESPRLALLLGTLARQLPNRFYASIDGQLSSAVEYHPAILEAIRRRDPEAAAALMHRHIVGGGEQLVAMLERQGVWADAADAADAADTASPSTPARPASRPAGKATRRAPSAR